MHLSIVEFQSGILKCLNAVELIYVLQGRWIATFHNAYSASTSSTTCTWYDFCYGANKSMCDLNKNMIIRFTEFMCTYAMPVYSEVVVNR